MYSPDTLANVLAELQLIRCSLLPGEALVFLEDSDAWTELLEIHAITAVVPEQFALSPVHVQIKVTTAKIWFEVEIDTQHLGKSGVHPPTVLVKGEDMNRITQERWQHIINDKTQEIALAGDDYPIYHLISLHLLPLLQAELESAPAQSISEPRLSKDVTLPPQYHALLTSHHLISPNKRRSLRQWSSSLSIAGFAKVGYPGVIYAQGEQEHVEEFVANVKGMQWLALKVRFVEPVAAGVDIGSSREKEGRWSEFQKVGEVVEAMRQIGREEFIVEMGIGSAGAK